MFLTLGLLFEQTVQKYPTKEAIVDRSRGIRWTYEEWDKEVNKLANAFIASGVRKGDRVSTFLFNSYELGTVYFAAAKIGAIINPINFRLRADEVAYILNDAKPKIVLFEQALEPQIAKIHEQFPSITFWSIDESTPSYAVYYHDQVKAADSTTPTIEVSEDDIYAIMYTSGTTGKPKGVMHRHAIWLSKAIICNSSLDVTPDDMDL